MQLRADLSSVPDLRPPTAPLSASDSSTLKYPTPISRSLILASFTLEPLINPQRLLYHDRVESRVQIRIGGTHHFGFYNPISYWPFPIGKALRAMEEHFISDLALGKGSKVLDECCPCLRT